MEEVGCDRGDWSLRETEFLLIIIIPRTLHDKTWLALTVPGAWTVEPWLCTSYGVRPEHKAKGGQTGEDITRFPSSIVEHGFRAMLRKPRMGNTWSEIEGCCVQGLGGVKNDRNSTYNRRPCNRHRPMQLKSILLGMRRNEN